MPRIWVVDDDPEQQMLLSFVLTRDGFEVRCFGDGREMLDALEAETPELLLLDLGLPEVGGLEVLQRIRADRRFEAMPIIMLTASRQVSVRYVSLAAGVDDFLTKPVDPVELVLRVKTRLRAAEALVGSAAGAANLAPEAANMAGSAAGTGMRARAAREAGSVAGKGAIAGPGATVGGDGQSIHLDTKLHEVAVGNRRVALTPSEFALLRYLMERPGEPIKAETLLVEALGYPPRVGSPETVRNHLRNLRAKVERDPSAPRYIVNVPRVGYLFRPDGEAR